MVKNTAGQKIGAQLVSATDGSAFTGAVTVSVTVDAGTQATGSVGSGACAHEGNGYHTYAPAQAETNGALIAFTFTGTGAVPATVQVFTTVNDPATALATAAALSTVDGIVDDILVDTAEIGAAGAGLTEAGGTGDQLTAVPWNAAWDTEVQSEAADALNAYDPPTKAELDTAVDALPTAAENATQVRTELGTELGRIDAAVSTRATPAQVATELGTYDAPTKAELDAAVATLATSANLTTAQSGITAIKAITDALTAAAAAKLAASALGLITGTVDTTVSPSTTVFEADDITEATADHYIGRIVTFTSGVLLGQSTDITDYALNGGRGQFTVTALTEAPGNNDTFVIS